MAADEKIYPRLQVNAFEEEIDFNVKTYYCGEW